MSDIQLQARKPEGGDWTDIYPAQLSWMSKEGYDVRAIASCGRSAVRDIDLEYYEGLLREIGEIVRVPTSATPHRKAKDHFQADFDAIRKVVAIGLRRPNGAPDQRAPVCPANMLPCPYAGRQ